MTLEPTTLHHITPPSPSPKNSTKLLICDALWVQAQLLDPVHLAIQMAHRKPATGDEVVPHQQVTQTADETEVQTSAGRGPSFSQGA